MDTVKWKEGVVSGCVSLSGLMRERVSLEGLPVSLRELSLASNNVRSVDLKPLAVCIGLKSLALNGNSLKQLDLSPLSRCQALEKLWLHNNSLRSINLNGLSPCSKLRSLYLDGNEIHDQSIDLLPLRNCFSLRSLRLSRNLLDGRLDISPLLSCKSLTTCDVSASVRLIAVASPSSCGQPSAGFLPPAFRRRAAAIEWRTPADLASDISEKRVSSLGEFGHDSESIGGNGDRHLAILLLGYHGSIKYAIQKLLESLPGVKTVSCADISGNAFCNQALKAYDCILLRGRNVTRSLVALRSLDRSIPIFVVQYEDNLENEASHWYNVGATGVLQEPLLGRDLIVLRTHMLERAELTAQLSSDENSSTRKFRQIEEHSTVTGFPTSPVTSSESSPPSGVPALTNVRGELVSSAFDSNEIDHARNVHNSVKLRKSPYPSILSKANYSSSFRASSRVEESGMCSVFSKLGGYARSEDFDLLAAICGMPVCSSSFLYDALVKWVEGVLQCSHQEREEWSCLYRLKSEKLVSHNLFTWFWDQELRNRDCDQRLFFVISVVERSPSVVSVNSLSQIAARFISHRNSRSNGSNDLNVISLGREIMRYELNGTVRSRFSRKEFIRTGFCSSLLAAESGMYDGVAYFLRTDRMLDIISVFDDAIQCDEVGESMKLSLEGAIKFNSNHGLLISRAVEAHFNLLGCPNEISVAEFAPMWLAARKPESTAASSYFFHLLDLDQDGYLSSFDIMHFYNEKSVSLINAGFVPVKFQHLWRSLSDNISLTPSSSSGSSLISLPQIESIPERERILFWQSVLFLQDELSLVNIRCTVEVGDPRAAQLVRSAF